MNGTIYKQILFVWLTFFLSFCAVAQQGEDPVMDSLAAQLDRYTAVRNNPQVYLHIDKTVYVGNENVWFTGYLLQDNPLPPQHTLHVVLLEEATKEAIISERFIIDNGIAKGSIFLADSLLPGEYRLVAYTNTYPANPHQSLFQQPISIRSSDTAPFNMSLLPVANKSATSDSVRFTYKVGTSYGGLASDGSFSYQLTANGAPIQSGKKKINAFGEVEIAVSRSSVLGKKIDISATIEKEKDKQIIKAAVPLFQKAILIDFYPEGGNLVANHPTRMAFEVKNSIGRPVVLKGKVLEGDKTVANLSTDSYGTGIIEFTPQTGKSYSIQAEDTSLQLLYTIPTIKPGGYSLTIKDAVISDTSLAVEINTPADGSSIYLMLHDYNSIFSLTKLLIKTTKGRYVMPIEKSVAGIATLTLFNDKGIPQAERAVYIKKPGLHVTMSTDSSKYHHRSKVTVKVKVTDDKGDPVQSFFSLSTALGTRVDSLRYTDIRRFHNFDRFLPLPTVMPPMAYLENDQNIEMALLTKFWTRYKWENIIAAPVYNETELPAYSGSVLFREKPLKAPAMLVATSKLNNLLIDTDSSGHFQLFSNHLISEPDKKVMIIVGDKKTPSDYRIDIKDHSKEVLAHLAKKNFPEGSFIKAELTPQEKGYLAATTLKAVVVTAKRDDYRRGVFRSTTCNDWVCMYNVLNCRNHPFGTTPVNGETYYDQNRSLVTYYGCVKDSLAPSSFIRLVKGTYYQKEFYKADYQKFNPAEPEMMSTIFWSHQLHTNEQGEATLDFYTNDLNGRFVSILQGVSSKGVMSGSCSYHVSD